MKNRSCKTNIDLWGGIECTINRISDTYLDQLDYSGHYNRADDISLFAALGIKKIRYPVLWEKHYPDRGKEIDWNTTERNLQQLKEHHIEPIAGLVHHGSGPSYVNMLDHSFAEGLADYASRVAEKFPWITYYTPVNEPLTTARFCGLYGHWYPHKQDDRSFIKILVNECKGIIYAMRAIRKINPEAKLIQTEDLAKIHSTPLLKYQADFENNRRWLAFDLLCGRVTPAHPMWKYLISTGINKKELFFFLDNFCKPDILGFNYYLTSERYLDENLEKYPPQTHGGNHMHRYADIEVVRAENADLAGPHNLLKEAWERFRIPLAMTEVHLNCTREEQLRWFNSIWNVALALEKEQVDIRAVTAWAMLGSYGWNKLLTQPDGEYECGVFDVSSDYPRPTALSKMIRSLAAGEVYKHPVLDGKGWWEKNNGSKGQKPQIRPISSVPLSSPPLLIIGKNGTLGSALAGVCKFRNIKYQVLERSELDITNISQVEKVIKDMNPWAVVNAAGYVRVDEAETQAENCFFANVTGPENLAKICSKYSIKLVTFSSDLVFDGAKYDLYVEDDHVNPLNVYGKSKALAEDRVLKADPDALIIRTSAFFGPWDRYNFVTNALMKLTNRLPFFAEDDVFISPTYVPDLANTSLNLLLDEETGIWHLTNKGSLSWAMLAAEVAERAGCDKKFINRVRLCDMDYAAKRPKFSALKSQKGLYLPSLDNALDRYFSEQRLIAV